MDQACLLVGPTASGKTAVATAIARIMPVEIIPLDSMTVYRGMDIGTAKPSAAERAEVPHHLVDVLDPTEAFSVGTWLERVETLLPEIVARGRTPLFVGGTPLYLKALTAGLFDAPGADEDYRAELHARAETGGVASLHAELAAVDPEAARRVHPNDLKRIVRALEVRRATGRPISELQTQWSAERPGRALRIAGIERGRAELYDRINRRVDAMFEAGLLGEVRGLLARYGALGEQASQAVGYRELLAHLAGETDLERTIELVKRNTRRMAKRQLTWFRSFGEITWFRMDASSEPSDTAARIVAFYRS
jgi:tRNA dimethylallyltransferase